MPDLPHTPTSLVTRPFLCFPRVYHPVFIPALVVILSLIVAVLVIPEPVNALFDSLNSWINQTIPHYYDVTVILYTLIGLGLAISPFGKITLGQPNERPEFSFLSWIAMLFSAGIGIGLIYYGLAEPISYYTQPPLCPNDLDCVRQNSFNITFLHYGIHVWAIYSIVALSVGYFAFRKGLPFTFRSCLAGLIPHPTLQDKVGDWIDIFAVFGTLFGVATSLGLGVTQMTSGLHFLLDIPNTLLTQVILITVITGLATFSVLSGLGNGIKRFSQLNIILASALLILILSVGPTVEIATSYLANLVAYGQFIFQPTTWFGPYAIADWEAYWSVFYWGWWISWAPFVGLFLGRISRGRTIREFIAVVFIVPSLLNFLWIHTLGTTGIHMLETSSIDLMEIINDNVSVALFVFFEQLPLGSLMSILAMVVLTTFFVTSSDSGSLVIDMITAGGESNPPKSQKVFWAVLEGIVAATLLALGGLTALQTATLTTGLPISIILFVIVFHFVRTLIRQEQDAPEVLSS